MPETAARKTINIPVTEPVYYLDENVSFTQRDAWFGHVTRDLKMNVIYPQTKERVYPCIVWICGGGWIQMDKGAHMPYLADLARRGFVVASVEYRLSNEAAFPAALTDVKAAIRYLRAHASRYAIDPVRFGVMGESAGGYLAAMTALTADRPEFETGGYLEYSSAVQAACPWYMPADFMSLTSTDNYLHLIFFGGNPITDENVRRFTSPVTYITDKAPPFLLIHGTADTLVPFSQSEFMFDELNKHGLDVRLLGLEGGHHADRQFFQRETWDIIDDFFKKKLPPHLQRV